MLKTLLALGNEAYKARDYALAEQLYLEAANQAPSLLKKQLDFNLSLTHKRLGKMLTSELLKAKIEDDLAELLAKTQFDFNRRLKEIQSQEIHNYEDNEKYLSKQNNLPIVLYGTLFSGENELEASKLSVQKQDYPKDRIRYVTYSHLPKQEAMHTLYTHFLSSDCDLLVKLDADMVLLDSGFTKKAVLPFIFNSDLAILQCALLDYFSGGAMQGINVYSKKIAWNKEAQDKLFTDKMQIPKDGRMVEWSLFSRSVIHCPNPTSFQAFHFGVHRGIKVREAFKCGNEVRGNEQLTYLEKTHNHYQIRKDEALLFACLGAEYAMSGQFTIDHLNYTNPALEDYFANVKKREITQLEKELSDLRKQRLKNISFLSSIAISTVKSVNIKKSFLLFVPHLDTYGGVNRFLELARQLKRLGHDTVVCVAGTNTHLHNLTRVLDEYPEIDCQDEASCRTKRWDVVVCGDYSSGIMLRIREFYANTYGIYLLNGYQHRLQNIKQIECVRPDVIWANSSYCAKQYPSLVKTVLPGGIDTSVFYPSDKRSYDFSMRSVKVVVPAGRLKSRKRFKDALKALEKAVNNGISIELHVFNSREIEINTTIPMIKHVGLGRHGVAKLYREADIAICPEEDAGWNNPAAEAMACGTPLICTAAGTTDFAVHEVTALVVPPRSSAEIFQAIVKLLRNPDKTEQMVLAGLNLIKNFEWSYLAKGLVETVESQPTRAEQEIIEQREKARKAVKRFFATS